VQSPDGPTAVYSANIIAKLSSELFYEA